MKRYPGKKWVMAFVSAGVAFCTLAGTLLSDEIDEVLAAEELVADESVAEATAALKDDPRIAVLVEALQRKEIELAEAEKEIARLTGLLAKADEVNMRERVALYYNLGCLYRIHGAYEKAEKKFLQALELNPKAADVHYNLGILYDEDLKNRKKARKHYSMFLNLSPSQEDAARVREWLAELE